jgi:hypothetical protein
MKKLLGLLASTLLFTSTAFAAGAPPPPPCQDWVQIDVETVHDAPFSHVDGYTLQTTAGYQLLVHVDYRACFNQTSLVVKMYNEGTGQYVQVSQPVVITNAPVDSTALFPLTLWRDTYAAQCTWIDEGNSVFVTADLVGSASILATDNNYLGLVTERP